MKIAVISNLYSPYERGGAEKVVKSIANELKKDNQVLIITTKPFENFKSLKIEKIQKNNLEIFRFFPLNIFYYLNDYTHNAIVRLMWHFFNLFNPHSYFLIKKILKSEKPDLIVSHNLMGLGFLIPKAIEKLKLKWIHVIHDVQLAVPSGLIIKGREKDFVVSGFLTKLYSKINKKIFGSPRKIVSPSKWLLNFYDKKGFFPNSQKQVLPNPVSFEIKEQARFDFEKPLNLFFVGQIQEHKGIIFLIKSLKQLDLEFKLIIVGSGTKEIELKSLIFNDNRFKFLGKVNSNEIKQLFVKTDYLIVPSLCYENSPTVIYEAFSQAIPVIAANIGGVAELVREGKTGFVFEPANKESLLLAIKKAAQIENYSQVSRNCLDVVEKCIPENYVKNLIGLTSNSEMIKYN